MAQRNDKKEDILYGLLKDTFELDGEPFRPYSYQLKIAKNIYFKETKRLLITAPTRSGKTLILSLVCILFALKYPNSKIRIIAPSYPQAKVMMRYVLKHLSDDGMILSELPVSGKKELEKEMSKSRVTFNNDSEIMILSAQGEATRLMGHGGDLVICDESPLIEDEVFSGKIMRMVADNPDSILVEIGNPVRLNHFKEHFEDPRWKNLHISYEDCVEEGRFTESQIEEFKSVHTEREFKILFEAEFPEELESGLFKYNWIADAVDREFDLDGETVAGVDVGRTGDLSVLTIVEKQEGQYQVKDIYDWQGLDTEEVAERVEDLIDRETTVNVDATGMGEGVYDTLKHDGYTANEMLVGKSPTKEKDKFLNQKSQYFWRLRKFLEEGRLSIPEHPKLVRQLRQIKLEYTSADKRKIVDPQKSPDFADSLMLACSGKTQPELSMGSVRAF